MLCALGEDAVALRRECPQDIDDIDIFSHLTNSHKVFVSADLKQRRREAEAKALKASGITAIYFAPFYDNLLLWQQAAWILKVWPTVEGFLEGTTKGTVAEIKQNGKALIMPF